MKEKRQPAYGPGFTRLLIFLLFILFCSVINAQTVSGKVLDDEKKPISGANIAVKGTNKATASDASGNFTIAASSNDILIVSYVGYSPIEIPISGRTTLEVPMVRGEGSNLDAVVVTALGIRREARKLGYATETVKLGDIQKNRTVNLAAGLEGKVAGLDISPPSAGAGASTKIRLRGQASFAGGDNGPLLVINGLPMSQGARGANGTGNQNDQGDNLLLVNPDDIESMTVLKGSTAAALYGARAANGAIIITTKSGTKNTGIGIEIASSYNSDQVIDLTDFQYEYGQGTGGVRPATAAIAQSNGQFGFGERYDGKPTPQFDGVSRPYSPNKNRVKEFFRNGNSYSNTVALSGGNAKGSFRVSYTRLDAQGIVPNNTYRRNIFNVGTHYNLTDKLSAQVNINYTNEQNRNPPAVGSQGASVVNFLYRVSPVIPLQAFKEHAFDANGNETRTTNFNTTLLNPYFDMVKRFNRTHRDRILSTATIRYDAAKWLYVQGRANMDFSTSINDFNTPTGSGAVSNASLNNAGTGFSGNYTVSSGDGRELNMDFLVGTNQKFSNFSVDASVGGNTYINRGRNNFQRVFDFVVRDLYTIQNGLPSGYLAAPPNNSTSTYTVGRSTINSLYAFADIGYKNFIYLNLTGRQDWYSRLNPKNNSFFYPSVSGSFIFSELLDGKRLTSWLNYGKLRGGYSVVGSQNGVNDFEGTLAYNITSFDSYILADLPGDSPNPELKPFSIRESEVGLELKMFGSRVSLDMSYYNRITEDQIVRVPNSAASGFGGRKINYGKLRNRGAEFLLEVTPVRTKGFTWVSSFNTAYNKTKVLALAPDVNASYVAQFNDGAELFGAISNVVGQEMNQISGRTYLRNAKGEILVTSTGRLRGTSSDVLFGSALPKYTGGWNNTFTYKGIGLLIHFDYKAGGKMLSGTALNGLRQGHSQASLVGRREGETGIIFPGVYDDGSPNTTAVSDLQGFYGAYRSLNLLDPFVFKSDFIKLRNITLSYDCTRLLGSKLKFVKGLVLSASCRNVAIIKKHVPDIDPESFASSGDFRVGYEQSSLPTSRTYGVNLNVKF